MRARVNRQKLLIKFLNKIMTLNKNNLLFKKNKNKLKQNLSPTTKIRLLLIFYQQISVTLTGAEPKLFSA